MDTTALLKSVPTGIWIGGEERKGSSTFDVLDPSDDSVLISVANATAEDAIAALDAAAGAQAEWAATPPRKRGEVLRSVFETITERAEDLATLMTLEMGKVLRESMGEVTYGAEFFRWFAEEAVRIHGRYTPSPAGTGRIIVTKQPVGPCYAITPWNFPLAMGTRKIGPAVAAGCTMIVKPAQETPLTMLLLAKLMDEAGLPKGVLSVLPTNNPREVTTALIDDGRLRKLTFTGSTGVGKALVKQSSDALLRTSMELGGNAPFVVFDDADVDAAVEGAILAKMRNGGEACTAANRFHVANSVREEFTEKLVKRMSEFQLGKGIDESSTLGPLINAKQVPPSRIWCPTRCRAARRWPSAASRPAAPATSIPRRCWPTCPPTPASSRRRCSGPSRRSPASTPRRRAWPPPTTPSTAWPPTSTPATSTARCGSPRASSPAWSASTAG